MPINGSEATNFFSEFPKKTRGSAAESAKSSKTSSHLSLSRSDTYISELDILPKTGLFVPFVKTYWFGTASE